MRYLIFIIIIFYNNIVYSNNLFETAYQNVEFTSTNIENDKIRVINKIKVKSLLSILKKSLTNEYYMEVNSYLNEDLINTFIKNVIITDEIIINNQYISKIKINFSKDKIINFYRSKKIPYVEYHPNKFLLIIFEKNKINDNLLTKNNNYYKYFINNLKDNNFFQIPNLDINDRFILQNNHVINKDLEKIKKFFKKYNSEENIIVIAELINNNEVNYDLILFSEDQIISKKLKYNKKDIDIFFKILEDETLNIWKNINQIQNKFVNNISCNINYFNMLELKEVKSNLKNVSLIKNLIIKSLSFKKIEYDIQFYGNLNILFKVLKLNNLQITNNSNLCTIKLK